MIKAGQIYKQKDNNVFVIVYINEYNLVHILYNDDLKIMCTMKDLEKFIEKECKLVAKYPTWQEAVNSKEFNYE